MSVGEYDLFISHATEDKESFVRPLVSRLTAYGLNLWYDESSLNIGDSLSRSIDKGLAKSRYGVVVLSPAFFEKKWPEYELRGLTTRELDGESIVLPIWHNVTKKVISDFSPSLADKIALNSKNDALESIAQKIVKTVRPDIFRRVSRKLLSLEMQYESNEDLISIKQRLDKELPALKEDMPDSFRLRIRLIRAVFLGVINEISFNKWCDTISSNENPEEELLWFENIASAYLEYMAIRKPDWERRKHILKCVLGLALSQPKEQYSQSIAFLNEGDLDFLKKLLGLGKHFVEVCNTYEELLSISNGST